MEMRAYLSDYVPYANAFLEICLILPSIHAIWISMNISNFSQCLPYPPNFKTETQPISPEKPNPAF